MGCRRLSLSLSALAHLPPLESWSITAFFLFLWSHWPRGIWDFTMKAFCVTDPLQLLSDFSHNRSLQSLEVWIFAKVCSVAWNAVISVPAFCAGEAAFLQLWQWWMTDFSLLLFPLHLPSSPLGAGSVEYYFLKHEERKKEKRESMAYLPVIGRVVSPSLVPCQNKRRELEQHLTLSHLLQDRPKNTV